MSTPELRRRIKKGIDRVPPERLESLAEFVAFLNQPTVLQRLTAARKAIAARKGVNWRKVRADV